MAVQLVTRLAIRSVPIGTREEESLLVGSRGNFGRVLSFAFCSLALLHQGTHKALFNIRRNRLRFHTLVDLDRLFCRITDYPAIRALADVTVEVRFRLGIKSIVEVLAQLGKELLTGKHRRRPLFA